MQDTTVVCRLRRELGICTNSVYQDLFSPPPHGLRTRVVSSSIAKVKSFALLFAALHIFHSHSSQCVSVSQATKFNFTELIINLNSGLPLPPSTPTFPSLNHTTQHTVTHHLPLVIIGPVSGVEDTKGIARRNGNTTRHLQKKEDLNSNNHINHEPCIYYLSLFSNLNPNPTRETMYILQYM